MEIRVVVGDITKLKVDAIVNAANRSLAGGGGVDGAIHRAAGSRQLQNACRLLAPCEVGRAVVTPGFMLPAEWIIHTVGPVWRGGGNAEPELLASCYRSSLQKADELSAKTIAFPAISTGVYGYPAAEAAKVAVDALRSATSQVDVVFLVAFDEGSRTSLDAALTSN